EDSYGISYENIDDFLEGRDVGSEVVATVRRFYTTTRHERSLPLTVPAS
ncbi:NAD(+) synthase, partial [Caballeronia sp. LZ002]|nr:NAD(+) synthase [Caballeronia sp. LZ002]MDR5851982.1 NAD(+) synthase [Caballeronia sp. LZ003]